MGKKKSRKDKPARQRYKTGDKAQSNKRKRLERIVREHPNDTQAAQALAKLR